jgi:hypothetical protein
MNSETWKSIHDTVVGIWSVAGPLLGVFIGAYIANRNQRKQWIADNKRAEYREVLGVTSKVLMTYLNAELSSPDLRAWHMDHPEALVSIVEVFGSRIFTASVLRKLRLTDRFVEVFTVFAQDRDSSKLIDSLEALNDEILGAALSDIGM